MPLFSQTLRRRALLQQLSALGLGFTVPALEGRAAERRGNERARSLITLWMDGGMSQLETWDPHAGTAVGGEIRAIPTSAPGIEISELLPQTAEQIHRATLIRSLTSLEGDHARGRRFVKTGYRPDPTLTYPSLGAVLARYLPSEGLEIPAHVALGGGPDSARGGYLGSHYDAYRIFEPGNALGNLKPHVADHRQSARLRGLEVVSSQFRRQRQAAVRDTMHQDMLERALTMMSSDQLSAFELDREPEAVRAAYGDTRFGRGCLVARRLVETGVRAVEVTLPGFDYHAGNHSGHVSKCEILDPALATLLQDLADRDLLESTIVLCITEFGRTPQINAAAGRDHWPNWFSCLVAGGGFAQGRLIGETPAEQPKDEDRKTARPSDPVTIPELYATIMQAMAVPWHEEFITPIARPIRLADADPRSDLLADG